MNMYCSMAGYHQDEPLELVCLNQDCIQNNKVLNCIACMEENHIGHQVIHFKKFQTLIQKQGVNLLNEIDCRLGESMSQFDLVSKLKDILKQLTELQDTVNDAINKQKEMLERKLQYYDQFSSQLPNFDIFNKAFKLHDFNLIQKLMSQFLSKVEYNQKRQDFNVRREYLQDLSEETEGENQLFKKLKEILSQFKNDSEGNYPSQRSYRSNSQQQKKLSTLNNEFKRSGQRLTSYKRMISIDKSPGSPDDRMSVTQSLSQFYHKSNVQKKRVGQQISLIEASGGSLESTFNFHPECFGQGLQITSKQVKLTVDSDRKMALIKPSIYGSGLTREQKITLIIKVCRSSNQRYPMAVGICDQQKLKEDNYIFSGAAEHVPNSTSKDHGCYLLNSNGYIRAMSGPDLVRSSPNLRFYSNSIIEMTFKPFHKQLVINRDSQVQTTIPMDLQKDQKLFFCVRLADLYDCIEIQ